MNQTNRPLIPFIIVLVIGIALVYLNIVPGSEGSIAFEEQHFPGFAPSHGWPLSSWTYANKDGLTLINASVVIGGAIFLNHSHNKQYPHLVVNWIFMGANVFLSLIFLSASFFLSLKLTRRNYEA